MSVHIVDRIEAIRFPAAAIGHYEDVFLVMELGGDNNCTNARTGRRAKSWSATCIGPDWVVIGDCCRYAASCEGGSTKLKGRRTTPESYIRAYRKALANATGLQDALVSRGLHIRGRIRFNPAEKDGAYALDKAIKGGKSPVEIDYFGTKMLSVEFNLDDSADLTLWNECRHGTGWNNCDVHGPGTH